ncbi:MAG: DNA polymerase-1 [Myxococcota bacterium]|jgi:DNA polymerase-1
MERALLIIDGTVLVLRPWFAKVSAPWAVARNQLRKEAAKYTHVAVVIDRTMDTFRRKLDPRYKAHRPPASAELIAHFNRFEEEVTKMGIALFGSLEVEADDLAATLTRHAVAAGLPVLIQAPDKDLFQLIRDAAPSVRVIAPKKGWDINEAGVMERLGVTPSQVTDFQALVGDATDGVIGVAGVGAKTAAALLTARGTLDAIYADLDGLVTLPIRGAKTLPRKLLAGKDDAMLARRLVTLRADVDMGADPLAKCEMP